jgi:Tfp pilus assembly protein PilV
MQTFLEQLKTKKGFALQTFEKQKLGGFTLLEVLLAIFILTLGIAGALTMIQKTVEFTSIISSRTVAAYLLQEGIEIVRNIRDTNWLEQYYKDPDSPDILWDEGIPVGNWEVDYTTQSLIQAYTGNYFNIDAQGFYSYLTGKPTKFERRINIAKPDSNIIEVFVQVKWRERGRTHSLSGQENLYNWFSP